MILVCDIGALTATNGVCCTACCGLAHSAEWLTIFLGAAATGLCVGNCILPPGPGISPDPRDIMCATGCMVTNLLP